jgi:hypothetical protein
VNPELQIGTADSIPSVVINEVPKLKASDSLLEDWRLPCIIFPLPYGALAKDPSLPGDFVRSPNPAESRKFYLISTLQIH